MIPILRKVHLYLGVFFAPLLLFFVITGSCQSISEDRLKHPSEAQTWIQKSQVIHTEMIFPSFGELEQASPMPFKILVITMSIALIVMVSIGMFLAFRLSRKQWHAWAVFLAGIFVPTLFLWLGLRI